MKTKNWKVGHCVEQFVRIQDEENNWIAGCYPEQAQLIAAAPELLDALKSTAEQLATWFEMADPSDVNGNDKAILSNARQAIAKAEGNAI